MPTPPAPHHCGDPDPSRTIGRTSVVFISLLAPIDSGKWVSMVHFPSRGNPLVYVPPTKAAITKRGFICTSLIGTISRIIKLTTTGTFASKNGSLSPWVRNHLRFLVRNCTCSSSRSDLMSSRVLADCHMWSKFRQRSFLSSKRVIFHHEHHVHRKRKHTTSSHMNSANKHFATHSAVQRRLSIFNWNPGRRRRKRRCVRKTNCRKVTYHYFARGVRICWPRASHEALPRDPLRKLRDSLKWGHLPPQYWRQVHLPSWYQVRLARSSHWRRAEMGLTRCSFTCNISASASKRVKILYSALSSH